MFTWKMLFKEGTVFWMLLTAFIYVVIWYANVNFSNATTLIRINKIESRIDDQTNHLQNLKLDMAQDLGEIKGDIKEIKAILRHER